MVGEQDAAEIVQAVFLQLFRKIGQFDRRSSFETWLYRLTVNESLQHLRRCQRWQFQTMEWEPMDTSPDGKSVEQRELLELALARLDPELRAIFLLRESEELSYREIAESMQIPEGTVGSRLNRARRELQQHLNQLGYDI